MASPNHLPPESIKIAYDTFHRRTQKVRNRQIKTLPDPYSARRFYAKMLAAGRNPKVIGAKTDDM